MLSFGFILAYWIGYGCSFVSRPIQWRFPLAVQCTPALILCAGIFICPDSPRWLIDQGRYDDAQIVLRKLHLSPKHGYDQQWPNREYREIFEELELEKTLRIGGFTELKALFTHKPYIRRLLLGCGIQVATFGLLAILTIGHDTIYRNQCHQLLRAKNVRSPRYHRALQFPLKRNLFHHRSYCQFRLYSLLHRSFRSKEAP